MPTDLQIIDGFEQLREQFVRDNPAVPVNGRPVCEETSQGVAEAWIQALENRVAQSGAPRRRLRRLARILTGEDNAQGQLDPQDLDVVNQAGDDFPGRLEDAGRQGLWPSCALDAPTQAERWAKALPAMTPLRVWRLMALLGRPVVVPEAWLRRFLWRYGLLENGAEKNHHLTAAHSCVQALERLTGLETAWLDVLLRWLTGSLAGSCVGGGWCAGTARCQDCPLSRGCGWARFHPQGDEDQAAPAVRRSIEPLLKRIETGQGDTLQETELLAVLLHGGGTGDSLLTAETLLSRMAGLKGLHKASVAEISRLRGLSRIRAIQLKAALTLGLRYASHSLVPGDRIGGSEDVWMAYRHRFRDLPQEHFVIILLDAKNRVIQDHVVSKGSLTGSMAHPREVFLLAVRLSAAALVLLHNHPSGDPHPSPEDRLVTERLIDAGQILGIRVLDHLILGADDYYSFKDEEEI